MRKTICTASLLLALCGREKPTPPVPSQTSHTPQSGLGVMGR